jgi:hypothetical protein
MLFSKIPFFSYPKHCFFLSFISYEHVSFFGVLTFCIFYFHNMVFLTKNPVLHATVYSFQLHTKLYSLSLLRIAPSADSIILVAVLGAWCRIFQLFYKNMLKICCNLSYICILYFSLQWADTYYGLVVELRLHSFLFLMMLCQFPLILQ